MSFFSHPRLGNQDLELALRRGVQTERFDIRYGRSVCQFDICCSVPIQNALRLIRATSKFEILETCDAVSICVPTPLRKTGAPDISHILSAADAIAEHLHPGMIVVLESTTYPGTTTEVILPRFHQEAGNLEVGKDFFLCFSPERVDHGHRDWTTKNTPKVMGGVTPECLQVGRMLYESAI